MIVLAISSTSDCENGPGGLVVLLFEGILLGTLLGTFDGILLGVLPKPLLLLGKGAGITRSPVLSSAAW